jgi:hypothetical protein
VGKDVGRLEIAVQDVAAARGANRRDHRQEEGEAVDWMGTAWFWTNNLF